MLSDGEPNLTLAAADSSASGLLPRQGEVAAKPPEGAPAFPTESPSSSSSSASSPPDSPCATPHSPRSAPPRRAVPTNFNPIINDEANILAAITRGDRTLFDLAEEHETTVSNLCIWLQREDIQQKLNDLSTCGAQITRVAAVNQLPKAVKAMAFQIEAHVFDRTHNLIKPGLAADKISALRDANARKACNLLLRLARFDPSLPLYRKRERTESGTLAPQGLAQRGEGGEVASAPREPVTGDLASLPAPAPQPDILNLCFSALAAITPESSRNPEAETRTPEPDLPSLCAAALSAASNVSDSEGRGWRGNRPVPLPLANKEEAGWRGNRVGEQVPAAISILQSDRESRTPAETSNHKLNRHTNGRVVLHTKSSESPPKSRPPPSN